MLAANIASLPYALVSARLSSFSARMSSGVTKSASLRSICFTLAMRPIERIARCRPSSRKSARPAHQEGSDNPGNAGLISPMEVLGLDVKREHVCQKHSEGRPRILGGTAMIATVTIPVDGLPNG